MDGVEIVMAVEDAFDICVADAEAEQIITPGQLIDLIERKVTNVQTSICLSHRAFNLLRSFLIERYRLRRKEIHPAAKLCLLIPRNRRTTFLPDLAEKLGAGEPPSMARPLWVIVTLLCIAIAAGVFIGWKTGPYFAITAWPIGILVGICGAVITKPLRTEFRKDYSTVGDLAQWIRKHKPDLATQAQRSYSREQIATRVRDIVVDVLGCEKEYREDARFVQDLGMD